MGLFDDLGIDMGEIKEGGFSNPDDGFYDFTISEAGLRNGSSKRPNDTNYVIEYDLDEAGTKQEWFTVAENGEVTAKALKSLGFLKSRLKDLGVEPDSFDPEEDSMEGITGTLQLKTGKTGYQNVSNVVTEEDDEEPEPAPEPKKAAAKKPVRAKAVEPKKSKAAVEPDEDEDEDEDDNPFQA